MLLPYNDYDIAVLMAMSDNHPQQYVRKHEIPLQHTEGKWFWQGCHRLTSLCSPTKHTQLGLNLPPCCKSHLIEMAVWMMQELQSRNIPYWIDFGSLLGWKRTGDIIPWDTDFDIGLEFQSMDSVYDLLYAASSKGYKLIPVERGADGKIRIYRLLYLNSFDDEDVVETCPIYVDIYGYDTVGPNTLSMAVPPAYPMTKSDVFPLKQAHAFGMEATVPNDVTSVLMQRYGKNWNIPVYDGWRTLDTTLNLNKRKPVDLKHIRDARNSNI